MEKVDNKKLILGGILLIVVVVSVFLYLKFFQTFTVTFEVDLGPGIQAQQVKINDVVIKPDDPVYDGYKFIGWYVDDEEYDFSKPVTESFTITAKWEKVTEN